MASFFERIKQDARREKAERVIDEETAATFGNTIFEDLPLVLKRRCIFNLIVFTLIGITTAILAIVAKEYSFLIGSTIIILFGILITYGILNDFKKGNVLEITGVLTRKEREGYRKQYRYANIEDENNRVYRIMLTDKQKRYKVGDIVTFYTTKDSIGQPVDAEYRIHKLYAVERVNMSVENNETGEENKENFDDLVIRPNEKKEN